MKLKIQDQASNVHMWMLDGAIENFRLSPSDGRAIHLLAEAVNCLNQGAITRQDFYKYLTIIHKHFKKVPS